MLNVQALQWKLKYAVLLKHTFTVLCKKKKAILTENRQVKVMLQYLLSGKCI